jgi:hypothetical protein
MTPVQRRNLVRPKRCEERCGGRQVQIGGTEEEDDWEKFANKLKESAEKKREAGRAAQGAAEGVEEIHGEEPEAGERKTVKITDPKVPSLEEIMEHEMTHLPHRNWGKHCVRGRDKEMGHKKSDDVAGNASRARRTGRAA